MKDATLSRRDRDKLRQRQEMLDSAVDLFSEKGFHNTSMHEVAKKAEFAIGTLYKFFKNKEDLYKALLMELADKYHDTLEKILNRDDDVLTILNDYIVAKGALYAEDVTIFRLYYAETRGASFNIKSGLDRDIRKIYDELVTQLAVVMKRGVSQKVFRNKAPYYLAITLEGIINAFLFSWLENPDQHSYVENIPFIQEIFLTGTLKKE